MSLPRIGIPKIPTTNDIVNSLLIIGYNYRRSPSPDEYDKEGLIIGCADETSELNPLELCRNGYPVIIDIRNLLAPIMIIVGKSGCGKSTLAKLLMTQLGIVYGEDLLVLTIDMVGEYYYWASMVGEVYSVGLTHNIPPFNVPGETPEEKASYMTQIVILSRIVRPDAIRQITVLKKALRELYSEKPASKITVVDLVNKLNEIANQYRELREPAQSVLLAIENTLGNEKGLRRGEPIDLFDLFENKRGIVSIDLRNLLVMESKRMLVFLILRHLITWMRKTERKLRIVLILDEAHHIIKMKPTERTGEHPLCILAREGRKYGVGMIIITQEIEDLLREDMVELYNNAGVWLIGAVSTNVVKQLLRDVYPVEVYPYYRELVKTLGEGKPFTFLLTVNYKDRIVPPTIITTPKFFSESKIVINLDIPGKPETITELVEKIKNVVRASEKKVRKR